MWLAGWGETHNGGCKITLWLSDPEDLTPFRSVTLRKGKTAGQRFQMVLVEIDEQEQPVPQKHHLSSDAHLMVTSEAFVRYVNETKGNAWDAPRVRRWVKYALGIESLAELDSDPQAALRFHREIREPYSEWFQHGQRIDDGTGEVLDDSAR